MKLKPITVDCHIEAPSEVVFKSITDFPNAAENISAITKVEMLTEGPVGKGTRFRETRIMFKKEASEEMEVVVFDPPRGYTLLAESHGCRYETTFSLTEEKGGTTVTMKFGAEALTFGAKVMGFLMSRLMTKMVVKECAKDLDDVKANIEGRKVAGA